MVQIGSVLLAASVVLFHQVGRVNSQAASCNAETEFGWSYNSLQQDPCAVATYLGEVCNPQYAIPEINQTQFYSGPYVLDQNECRCNTVLYSLLMACGECQGAAITSWSNYGTNCSTVYTGIFPDTIPPVTRIPHWAYLDVSTTDYFNATLAQGAGDTPESASVPEATSSSTPTSSPTSKNHSSSTGAIAGGVVGGVVGLALIAVGLFFFLRKRSQNRNVSSTRSSSNDDQARLSPDMTGTTNAPTMISSPSLQQKLYDPSDPTTFPTAGLPTATQAPFSSVHDLGNGSSNFGSVGAQRMYTGTAEV